MRAVALALAITTAGCFPHNAKHRRYAKLGEGAALLTGIAMQVVVSKNLCDMPQWGTTGAECDRPGALDAIGLGLIIAGIAGFATTVITAQPEPYQEPRPAFPQVPPHAFCAAIYRDDTTVAEDAVKSFLSSIGSTFTDDAGREDRVLAWLSRQPCVLGVERHEEPMMLLFDAPQDGRRRTFVVRIFGTHVTIDRNIGDNPDPLLE